LNYDIISSCEFFTLSKKIKINKSVCAIIINHDKKPHSNKLDDEAYNSLVEIEGNIMKLSPLATPSLLREYKKLFQKSLKSFIGMAKQWHVRHVER